MNPTFQFLKTKGLKLSLPLLLLATACGDGTPSASQGDIATVAGEAVAAAATPSGGFGTPVASDAGLPTPEISLPADDGEEVSLSDVLPPTSDAADAGQSQGVDAVGADDVTAVPEPTALLGLAVAAAGIVTLKRKQSA